MVKKKRALRADAARNRDKILEVAERLLGEQGPSMSTEQVARLAGVGVGTVFRHFPTKDALLCAVIEARVERLIKGAEALIAQEEGDSAALRAFFEAVLEHTASTPSVLHALDALGVDAEETLRAARGAFIEALGRLVTRAQQRGILRADVDVEDVFGLLVALVHASESRGRDPERTQRALRVIWDGLTTS